MKTSFLCAVLVTASLFALGCSGAPGEPDPTLESTEQALIPLDGSAEPDLEYDAAPPPPPPSSTTTCNDITDNGVCRRYCCTASTSFKRCGVVNCPSVVRPIVWTEATLLAK